jgi:hypothetical protein
VVAYRVDEVVYPPEAGLYHPQDLDQEAGAVEEPLVAGPLHRRGAAHTVLLLMIDTWGEDLISPISRQRRLRIETQEGFVLAMIASQSAVHLVYLVTEFVKSPGVVVLPASLTTVALKHLILTR